MIKVDNYGKDSGLDKTLPLIKVAVLMATTSRLVQHSLDKTRLAHSVLERLAGSGELKTSVVREVTPATRTNEYRYLESADGYHHQPLHKSDMRPGVTYEWHRSHAANRSWALTDPIPPDLPPTSEWVIPPPTARETTVTDAADLAACLAANLGDFEQLGLVTAPLKEWLSASGVEGEAARPSPTFKAPAQAEHFSHRLKRDRGTPDLSGVPAALTLAQLDDYLVVTRCGGDPKRPGDSTDRDSYLKAINRARKMDGCRPAKNKYRTAGLVQVLLDLEYEVRVKGVAASAVPAIKQHLTAVK